MPAINVTFSFIPINKDYLKSRPKIKMQMFWRKLNEKFLMPKPENEFTMFLLADLLNGGAKDTATIEIKEI